jgi:ferredoxin
VTEGHHTRAHAQWSASATARNSVCSGAVAMSSLCEDVEREAAAWGTACHECAEKCFVQQRDAESFIGETFKVGKFEFVFDEEMARATQTYVDYVSETSIFGVYRDLWIEQNFSLDALNPPLEAGGTADAVIYNPDDQLLEVVDLKAGRGVTVDVKGNPQGRTYAIGAVLKFPDLKVSKVKVTIVQPRVGDGLPKSDEFHVADLYDWTHDLLKLMQRAKDALDEFNALGDNRILFDEWADKWLTPGQCTFCTAKPICPALRKKALAAMPALAAKWHEDVTLTTPPTLTNLAKMGSPEELAHDLDGFDELEGWIKARRAFAHAEAERGNPPPGYGLVDKIANRCWSDEDAAAKALNQMGFRGEQILKSKLISPAQADKLLGKRKDEIASLIERPIRGTNLVRLDKTTRPAAKGLTERFNETVEQEN